MTVNATSAFAITPSDSVALPTPTTGGIWFGASGSATIQMSAGATVQLAGIVAGTYLPIEVEKVFATGTTSSILAVGFVQ